MVWPPRIEGKDDQANTISDLWYFLERISLKMRARVVEIPGAPANIGNIDRIVSFHILSLLLYTTYKVHRRTSTFGSGGKEAYLLQVCKTTGWPDRIGP